MRAWTLLAPGLVGSGVASAIIFTQSPEWIIGHVAADDYFYYLEIATRAARGEGFTFDGVTPTNGFHPLWMAILVVLAKFVPTDDGLVRAGLFLLGLCHAFTGVVLFDAVRRVTSMANGVVAAYLWWANPFTLAIAMSGTEAGLAALTLAGVFWAWVRFLKKEIRGWRVGLLMGLACLARTDMAVPCAVIVFVPVSAKNMVPPRSTTMGPFDPTGALWIWNPVTSVVMRLLTVMTIVKSPLMVL